MRFASRFFAVAAPARAVLAAPPAQAQHITPTRQTNDGYASHGRRSKSW